MSLEVVRIPVGQVMNLNSTVGWYPSTAAMEAAGNEIFIWAEEDDTRDIKATMTAKRRSVFTISQV